MINQNRKEQHHDKVVKLYAVEDAIHGYLAGVMYADAMLGHISKTLENSPNADKTIVIICSDHGFYDGDKGDWISHTLWERTLYVLSSTKIGDLSISMVIQKNCTTSEKIQTTGTTLPRTNPWTESKQGYEGASFCPFPDR